MVQDPMVEVFTKLGIALVVISFRMYARGRLGGFRKLQSDDYLMVLAACIFAAECAAVWLVTQVKGLSGQDMTDEQRASLDPNSKEWSDRVNGSKYPIMGWMTYTSLLWCLKACMVIFYFRLSQNVRKMEVRMWIGAVFVGMTYIVSLCVILAVCIPIQRRWQINPDPGPSCHSPNPMSTLVMLFVFNITTDANLICVPIPIIWKTRMDIKRKLSLTVLFAGAILTAIFGIIRCTILLMTPGPAGDRAAGPWAVRESFIATLVTNAPLIYPYIVRKWHSFHSSYISSRASEQHPGFRLDNRHPKKQVHSESTEMPSSTRSRLGKKFRGPYSIPDDTRVEGGESEERIVTSEGSAAVYSDTEALGRGDDMRVRSVESFGFVIRFR